MATFSQLTRRPRDSNIVRSRIRSKNRQVVSKVIFKPSCPWESKLRSFGPLLQRSIVVHHGSEHPPNPSQFVPRAEAQRQTGTYE